MTERSEAKAVVSGQSIFMKTQNDMFVRCKKRRNDYDSILLIEFINIKSKSWKFKMWISTEMRAEQQISVENM